MENTEKKLLENVQGGENPFSSVMSGYGVIKQGLLVSNYAPDTQAHKQHHLSYEYFKDLVLDPKFACVAAQSAAKSGNLVFCWYKDMIDHRVASGVCHDVVKYISDFQIDKPFNTFAACFQNPVINSQPEGVEALYCLFKNIHEQNRKYFEWSKDSVPDVESPDFGFSIAGESFFVPFLYSYSGSEARMSDLNFVIFNPHKAFSALRSKGAFEKLKEIIRARQSVVHPNLGDHGDVKEFIQYALVDPDKESQIRENEIRHKILGECPFEHNQSRI